MEKCETTFRVSLRSRFHALPAKAVGAGYAPACAIGGRAAAVAAFGVGITSVADRELDQVPSPACRFNDRPVDEAVAGVLAAEKDA